MGVKAYQMAEQGHFGKMVSFKNNQMEMVSLKEAITEYNHVQQDNYLLETARSIGISFGN